MVEEPRQNSESGWMQRIAIGTNPRRTLARLLIVLVLGVGAFFFFSYVMLPVRISGPSMYPTYQDGQINFINHLAFLHSDPKRGDVVASRFSGKHIMYVKRVVGLPGETIYFDHGKIMINGQPLDEPYLYLPSAEWNSQPRVLGPEEYYLVGDNRSMPYENHDKGGAERKRILGRIVIPGKVWRSPNLNR